ncbi:hypothetical protein [Maribacter hydrothermalis]|uniref:Uncharacterized protein n=1 Tax=Maribacter hydrothermalis TaxID=1836467 RepID=A0A1B7YZ50_9FLAO|nr:hypothetical protein [Maribacter hydrothermalis]APQ16085.1 hypothetical protein BTR34_01430 [Maribacter hydrothermalis]OBR35737.1 hypothetical protein A9200_11080 [Maribacter hydrothermalis]
MKLSGITISILFMFISLASSFKTAGVISYYALFTDDFVERFCENKARPEMNCNGECALSKMLSQDTDDEKIPYDLEWLKNEVVLFIGPLISTMFLEKQVTSLLEPQYNVLYSFHFTERIIHPPKF